MAVNKCVEAIGTTIGSIFQAAAGAAGAFEVAVAALVKVVGVVGAPPTTPS